MLNIFFDALRNENVLRETERIDHFDFKVEISCFIEKSILKCKILVRDTLERYY